MTNRFTVETFQERWKIHPRLGFCHADRNGQLVPRSEVSWRNINGIFFCHPYKVTYVYWRRGK